MYPSDKKITTITFGYWQLYPDTEFFRKCNLANHPHYGVDIAPYSQFKDQDIPIIAPVSGVIKDCYLSSSYGNIIKIQSSESGDTDREHRLAHLAKFYVKKGDTVKKGQIIGLMGSTGNSTAKHLHYEVRKPKNGTLVPVTPMPYMT